VAPGAVLAGNVTLGDRAFIGVGAVVRPDIRIGADAVAGAGAVVVSDVAECATVVGVPARPLKGANAP
jgi:UDP-perosamine 4-acetyltransferase